jgi:hypothetical protein
MMEAPKPRPVRQRGADQLLAALAQAVHIVMFCAVVTWLVWGVGIIAGWLG